VTAIAKGEPHHWTSMGGDAQKGDLSVMFDGQRVNAIYDPMRKQGAILLGNGGDNSNRSQGTFYEGAMTAAGTFPTDATDQKVQANVVAARYDLQPHSDTTTQRVRNASPVKINELRISSGPPTNTTDSFIELFNAGAQKADLSNWTLTEHAAEQAIFSPRPRRIRAPAVFRMAWITDSNCTDFVTEPATLLSAASAAGVTNLKVASIAGFEAGQTIRIDSGANLETAVIATVGTPAATTVRTATSVGTTVIPVASVAGFNPGQAITVGSDVNSERAVVAATDRLRMTVTVAAPLTTAHTAGVPVSGTGITLTAALTRAHANLAQVAGNAATPGAPNHYNKGSRANREPIR
jgi:hypothetical protein